MMITYPIIRGLAGGDIYFERLSRAMDQLDIKNEIKYYSHILQIAPFLIKPVSKSIILCDIIHSNVDCGFAFKIKSKPLVVTVHHIVSDSYYQRYTSFGQKIFHRALFSYITKSLSRADYIIAVSENTKKEIERSFGITDVKVIHNGIDVGTFKPLEVEDPYPTKIKLLFVGNLTKRKGADLLPKIMNKLDDRFILFYTSGLRTKKSEFSNGRMIPLGRLNLHKLVEMYNLCDMLVAPSRLEGFGYSVAEAMSCGKPVIASNSSSLPELIDDCKGGFLCDMDNADNFADKIELIASDGNIKNRFGLYNRKKILEKFSLEKMAEQYSNIYSDLI
jgi:glycosyltransferase involved in cell wall biosynthesis